MPDYRDSRRKSAWAFACALVVFGTLVFSAYPQARAAQTPVQSQTAQTAGRPAAASSALANAASSAASDAPAAPLVKPDARKAKQAFRQGQAAEKQQDWVTAYEYYSQAAEYAPKERTYAERREVAKTALVQSHIDAAERFAVSARLDDARRELLIASDLDPTNTVIRERLAEFLAEQTPPPAHGESLAGEPQLNYRKSTQNFNYRGDTRGAYDEVARQFGVEDSFDADMASRPVRLVINDADFPTVMRVLGEISGTFWRPISARMFFVAQDTPQKRRQFDLVAVRTVLLPASSTPDQMTETLRVVRDITGITRANLDTASRTITLRATPQALAVASDVIDSVEQPLGQLILEIEVLEVDSNDARQMGITPPEHATIYALTPQEIEEANQSASSLVAVISQIFGLPTSLSGLSPTQIAGLLSSGGLGLGSLLPPLVAFGGGKSTFLATLPGASANLSQTLSLVKHGMRVFLRAQDGVPTTEFFGEHFPVSLASYSSSLGGPQIPGISGSNFPSTNYPVGDAPQFVAAAVLRTGSAINDLIVANENSGNIGVLLGNGVTDGDGTFADQVTYSTDPANPASGPVWISTANFDESNGFTDIAVANKASNNVGILLASSVGDGTFQPATTIPVGRSPVSVIAARFHDADAANNHVDFAVANQQDNTIMIFTGNGNGTFVTPAATTLQLPGGYSPAGMAVEDLNGDGHLDLVVADQGNNTISVFLGNGDGTFQARTDYATGNTPVAVAVGDFNGDGIDDLAVANNGEPTTTNSGDSVTIYLGQKNSAGTANGLFLAGTTRDFPAGAAPTSLVVGDYNLDGLDDLVVSDGATAATGTAGDNAVSVLIGGGDGTFSSNFELPVGTNPQSLASADFNDDGSLDIATANFGSGNVTVILNSSSAFNGTGVNGSSSTPYPNVQYIDLGLKIKATPRIHADDEVTLDLDFTISSLAATNFNSIPVLNNESLTHTVRLKQDQTTVIASFMQPQTSNTINGTPGIAGLPGIGWLAQNQTVNNQDTELIFLVTPRLVRYAPRENREIYAGQGALEGQGGAATPIFNNPGAAGQPPPEPQQPGFVPGTQPGAAQPNAPQNGAQPTVQTPGQGAPQQNQQNANPQTNGQPANGEPENGQPANGQPPNGQTANPDQSQQNGQPSPEQNQNQQPGQAPSPNSPVPSNPVIP